MTQIFFVIYKSVITREVDLENVICTEAGCDRPVFTIGLCSRHYQRQYYRRHWRAVRPGEQPREPIKKMKKDAVTG